MDQVGTTRSRVGVRSAYAVAGLAALTTLAACTSGANKSDSAGQQPSRTSSAPATHSSSVTPSSSPVAEAAVITTSISGASKISPSAPINVSIANGKLNSVTMLNPAGKAVHGAMSTDGRTWHATEDLGYSRSYRLTAKGANADGVPVTKQEKISTVTPDNQTQPYLQRIGSYPLGSHQTYGVGIVPIVHFDEAIPNTKAAEQHMTVTTSPHVDGAWYWTPGGNGHGSDAHWRPKDYWKTGTKVTVSAKVYGVDLGKKLYGASDISGSFTIGRRQVTIAYDNAPKSVNKVRVYNSANHVIRTMNTSMGTHGGQQVGSNYINFYTMDGTYTVLTHEQPARMCSASYGLPANAPGGYPCENIYNATKISVDGIYLHYLNTFYAQNNGLDVSHGCLNLNESNSMWFFKHSIAGDPVVIHGKKQAPKLQVWQGGDWSVPWSTWVKGGKSTY